MQLVQYAANDQHADFKEQKTWTLISYKENNTCIIKVIFY